MFLTPTRELQLGLNERVEKNRTVSSPNSKKLRERRMLASSSGPLVTTQQQEPEIKMPPSTEATQESGRNTALLWRKLKVVCLVMSMHSYISERQRVLEIFKQGDALAELDEGEEAHIAAQGNPEFYTVENIKKRRAMKRDPVVLGRIRDLWEVRDMLKDSTGEQLPKESFILLMVRLHFLMVPPPVSLEKALIAADEDWIKDSGGNSTMSYEKFTHSIFELVDIWTESVDLNEYVALLDRIINGVTKLEKSELTRSRIFKDLKEIQFDSTFSQCQDFDGEGNLSLAGLNITEVDEELDDDDDDTCYEDDPAVLKAEETMMKYERSFHQLKREELTGNVSAPKKSPGGGRIATISLSAQQVLDASPATGLVSPSNERVDGVLMGDGAIIGANGELDEEDGDEMNVSGHYGGLADLDLGGMGMAKRAQGVVGKRLWAELRRSADVIGTLQARKKTDVRATNLLFYSNQTKRRVVMKPDSVVQTISKIYDAKIAQDTAKTKKAQRLMEGKKGDRFDTFVLTWHIQQYGTKKMAQRKLRLLLYSVRRLAKHHPRIKIFAKMVGVPIEVAKGIEEVDPKYKPRAANDFLIPLLKSFLKTNPKTGQIERLENFFGTTFSPKLVLKQEFISYAEKLMKWVPRNAPSIVQFYMDLGALGVDERGRNILLGKESGTDIDTGPPADKFTPLQKQRKKLTKVKKMIQRWVRRIRKKIEKRKNEACGSLEQDITVANEALIKHSDSRIVEKLRVAQLLDEAIDL